MDRLRLSLVILALGSATWLAGPLYAQPGVPAAAPPATRGAEANTSAEQVDQIDTFWEILAASGIIGLLIILISIAGVALLVEYLLTIRRKVLIPPGLADQVSDLLAQGKAAQAIERCRMEPSVLASVLEAGLAEVDGGWPVAEKALEDSLAEQSARLFRKVDYFSVIGSIAPMLGLLGTVVGMIQAFREVAMTQGAARAADLAEGIYLALVTTVEGLVVAIPALAIFALLRNRVDDLIAEMSLVAQHVFAPIRRQRVVRSKAATGAAPPTPPPVGGR